MAVGLWEGAWTFLDLGFLVSRITLRRTPLSQLHRETHGGAHVYSRMGTPGSMVCAAHAGAQRAFPTLLPLLWPVALGLEGRRESNSPRKGREQDRATHGAKHKQAHRLPCG